MTTTKNRMKKSVQHSTKSRSAVANAEKVYAAVGALRKRVRRGVVASLIAREVATRDTDTSAFQLFAMALADGFVDCFPALVPRDALVVKNAMCDGAMAAITTIHESARASEKRAAN